MTHYSVCTSCNRSLGNKYLAYQKQIDDLNSKVDKMRIDGESDDKIDAYKEEMSAKIVDSTKRTRYCCRARILGYIDLSKIVV